MRRCGECGGKYEGHVVHAGPPVVYRFVCQKCLNSFDQRFPRRRRRRKHAIKKTRQFWPGGARGLAYSLG